MRFKCLAFVASVVRVRYARNGRASRDDWIHVHVPYLQPPNTYYIIFRRAPTTIRFGVEVDILFMFATVAAIATCAASVPFILKLFKLVIQANTYNFTIMAIVAVLLIATFRYISSSHGWRWWWCTLYTARTHKHLHSACWPGPPHIPHRAHFIHYRCWKCNTSLPTVLFCLVDVLANVAVDVSTSVRLLFWWRTGANTTRIVCITEFVDSLQLRWKINTNRNGDDLRTKFCGEKFDEINMNYGIC